MAQRLLSTDRMLSKIRSKTKDPRVSLVESALTELGASRGNMPATRSAFIRYFNQGLKANVVMRELMDLLPIIFVRAKFSLPEALAAMGAVKKLSPQDIQAGG
jgi:hypothetical protein